MPLPFYRLVEGGRGMMEGGLLSHLLLSHTRALKGSFLLFLTIGHLTQVKVCVRSIIVGVLVTSWVHIMGISAVTVC